MKTTLSSVHRKHGFTLIELLVVIAIIAILAAMLLPALGSAKNRAQMVTDLNNQKQMLIAVHMYATDNRDFFPESGWSTTVDNWLAHRDLSTHRGGGNMFTYNLTYPNQLNDLRRGLLYPLLKTEKIFMCPADKVGIGNFYLRQIYITSYIINGGVSRYTGGRPVKISDGKIKSTYVLWWENDENKTPPNPAWEGQWNDVSNFPSEGLSLRHGKGATVGLVGGSARRMPVTEFWRMAGTFNNGGNYVGRAEDSRGTAQPTAPNELWWW